MKLKSLRETLLLTIFLQYKVRNNQKSIKGPSFTTTRGFLTWLLTFRLRMPHVCEFLDCLSFILFFFDYFLSHLACKTKFITFRSIIWIKQVKFLPSRCTSLLLHSKPVERNWLRFFKYFKKQCILRVNATKVTLRNTFHSNFFTLKSEKESKNDKRTFFWDCPRILDLAVNP